VDRDDLEATYAMWEKAAKRALKQIRKRGLDVVRADVKVEELLDWCQSENVPVNAQARSQYAAYKLQQLDK